MTSSQLLRIYDAAIGMMAASRSLIFQREFLDSALLAEGLNREVVERGAKELLGASADEMSADEIEAALLLADDLSASSEGIAILNRLLLLKNHGSHEDVARYLKNAADPSSIPCLSIAIDSGFDYLRWDEDKALARKCFWALSAIGTIDAWNVIEKHSESRDPVLALWANEQMDRRNS